MGWFDDQIRQKMKNDEESFFDSLNELSNIIVNKSDSDINLSNAIITQNSIDDLLKYYRKKSVEIPDKIVDIDDKLDFAISPHGIMRRYVKLDKAWFKEAIGPFIGFSSDGTVRTILPSAKKGYYYHDYETNKDVTITEKTDLIADAICFYKPLPLKKMNIKDLIIFMASLLDSKDIKFLIVSALFTTGLGFISPIINNVLFDKVIPSENAKLILSLTALMVSVSVTTIFISIISSFVSNRINIKLSNTVEASSMMRVLSLPPEFFKDYSSGELAERMGSLNSLCQILATAILSTGITGLFSLAYLFQLNKYASGLVVPALIIILGNVVLSTLVTLLQMKRTEMQMQISAKTSGIVYLLFSSVQKLKLSGSEKRAFKKWSNSYAKNADLLYNPPLYLKLLPSAINALTTLGAVFMYYMALKTYVSLADFLAFNVSYGQLTAGIMSLTSLTTTFATIKPIMTMAKPLLEAVPEINASKKQVVSLKGNIELTHVSFAYDKNLGNVIDDVSLKIRAGQYVAIVGETGCGKSTLMRMLLGFEKAQKGAIYYDNEEISKLDLSSLRKNIGTVLQSGKVFQGDIFTNVSISAPLISTDEAWDALKIAALDKDVRSMPMGLHTIISEGEGGISGGQRQRLLIARAVAMKPKILMFDEATSALDNITQKSVSNSLEQFKSTRIVIAHRLSTIKNCDRILVLNNGKIIEDGDYNSLIAQNGFFAELVERQQVNEN